MSRRRHTPEQIITALREAEVGLANGKTVAMVSRELGISEQTYYRWRQEFGGMKFVVFSYQLWEEFARPNIAQALGTTHNDVESDLMGEWRHLRNWIVHPDEKT